MAGAPSAVNLLLQTWHVHYIIGLRRQTAAYLSVERHPSGFQHIKYPLKSCIEYHRFQNNRAIVCARVLGLMLFVAAACANPEHQVMGLIMHQMLKNFAFGSRY